MIIRELEARELQAVLEEVKETFRGYQDAGRIIESVKIGGMVAAGAFDGPEQFGWVLSDSSGRILYVYVKEQHRHHGVGMALINQICQICYERYSVMRMTVEAPPELTFFFQKSGLTSYAPEQRRGETVYVPMERMMSPVQERPEAGKNNSRTMILAAVAAIAILVVLTTGFFLCRRIWNEVIESRRAYKESAREYVQESKNEKRPAHEEEENGKKEDADPLDEIEVYTIDVDYEVITEQYSETVDDQGISGDYDIAYPQVKDLPSEKDAEVNQILRDAAMSNADTYYLSPTEETSGILTELYEDQGHLVLGSEVDYKITYMDENLLSVIYTDHYFLGSIFGEYSALRARIVDLNTGERYEIEDLVTPSDSLIREWREKIMEEDPDNMPGKELDDSVYERMLAGEIVDTRYFANLFLTKDGVELGFTYSFRSEDDQRISRGWVTAPFTDKEINPYKTDHKMWDMTRK